MDSPRHSKFTEGELRLMSELGEKLCAIVDSVRGENHVFRDWSAVFNTRRQARDIRSSGAIH